MEDKTCEERYFVKVFYGDCHTRFLYLKESNVAVTNKKVEECYFATWEQALSAVVLLLECVDEAITKGYAEEKPERMMLCLESDGVSMDLTDLYRKE